MKSQRYRSLMSQFLVQCLIQCILLGGMSVGPHCLGATTELDHSPTCSHGHYILDASQNRVQTTVRSWPGVRFDVMATASSGTPRRLEKSLMFPPRFRASKSAFFSDQIRTMQLVV